ncbi:DUF5990 family protein [Streptomyces sp. NPDC058457]|uniref:DUF5990 family protein n=1 Tax=Streptomyces sp. NPDC058457 TaxID=3346507 RepID=UPI00366A37FE
MVDAVPCAVAEAAVRDGPLVGRLGVTDARGMPLCARVVLPAVVRSAGSGPQPSASRYSARAVSVAVRGKRAPRWPSGRTTKPVGPSGR